MLDQVMRITAPGGGVVNKSHPMAVNSRPMTLLNTCSDLARSSRDTSFLAMALFVKTRGRHTSTEKGQAHG